MNETQIVTCVVCGSALGIVIEDNWLQVENAMPDPGEMVLVVDVDIIQRGYWDYHGTDIEWRDGDNRVMPEVYWWMPLPKLPWEKSE